MSRQGSKGEKGGRHINEDLCRDLLNDLLSPEERQRALAHMAVCESCEKLFAERVVERERLRASRRLSLGGDGEISADRVIAPGGRPEAEEGPLRIAERATHPAGRISFIGGRTWKTFSAALRRPRYGVPVGLAAAALLLLILWPHPSEVIAPRHLPPLGELHRMRAGAEETESPNLMEGLAAYADRDYERAVDLLREAAASGQMETVRHIYLGSALAWLGRHEEAVAVLRGVDARTLPDPWGSETEWTLYVSLRALGQEASADSLLDVLAGERGEVGDRARRVRERGR